MATLYDDLLEGLTAMKEHLEGKRTLRTETLPRPDSFFNGIGNVSNGIRRNCPRDERTTAKRIGGI